MFPEAQYTLPIRVVLLPLPMLTLSAGIADIRFQVLVVRLTYFTFGPTSYDIWHEPIHTTIAHDHEFISPLMI